MMKNKSMQQLMKGGFLVFLLVCIMALPVMAFAVGIDTAHPYAWGENIGWLNWGTTEGAVDVALGGGPLTGYVWSENAGWISLNCSNTSSCATVDYSTYSTGNSLGGYAWGENVGWISWSCNNTSSCGTSAYGVSYNASTRTFAGFAYGENVGWISMNCSDTSSCGTVDFSVQTSPVPAGGGGPGGGPPPPPVVTAVPTPTSSTSPSPVPTVSATVSPAVTPTPTSSGTPLPSPTVSPPSEPPPPFIPPSSPPTGGGPAGGSGGGSGPIAPVVNFVQSVGNIIDDVATAVLGPIAPIAKEWCGQSSVQSVACGTTAVGVAAAAAGLAAGVAQKEVVGATYSMFQVVGLKRKAKVWGVVYDADTKKPVPFAKVELLDEAGRILESRFADREGRYGFLTSPASVHQSEIKVSIRVSKPGFSFPSKLVGIGASDYIVYDRLYHGEVLTIQQEAVINYNIPLDPTSVRGHSWSGWGLSLIGTVGDRILSFGFYLGLITVPLTYYLMPNTKNLIIMVAFFGANLFRMLVVYRPYGLTVDAVTGKPLPFALVTLNDASGNRVAFTVSDEYGRYILSGPSGQEYEVVAYTPANIAQQRIHREHVNKLKGWSSHGWITAKLQV
jgi:hypothetical protein